MSDFPTTKCRLCGELIFIALTREGRRRPVSAQQVINGNVRIEKGRAIAGPAGTGRYEFHLNSCGKKPRI